VLLRFVLFAVLFYLVYKLLREFFTGERKEKKVTPPDSERKVSKDIGEYVEYEDVKDKRKDK